MNRFAMKLSPRFLVGAFAAVAISCSVSISNAAPGDISRDELTELEKEHKDLVAQLDALQAAESEVTGDLGALEAELIAAAMESQRREEQATASEIKLISLQARLGSSRRELLEGEEALEGLMGSLAISGRDRPPALVTSAGDANTAIRTAILLSSAAPKVQDRTTFLVEEIDALRKLERNVRTERARLDTTQAALDLKKEEIRRMTAAKRSAFESLAGDARLLEERAQLLAREAETVRGLLAALEAEVPGAPVLKPRLQYANIPTSRTDAPAGRIAVPNAARTPRSDLGNLISPTSGRLVMAWGDKTRAGTKSEWMAFETRPDAQITAPTDGIVEWSAPFQDLGRLLIISTGDGYHVILRGLASSDVAVGQSVKQGEPVGRMANRAAPAPELRLEVRKDGKPMNPAKWMKRE